MLKWSHIHVLVMELFELYVPNLSAINQLISDELAMARTEICEGSVIKPKRKY